MKRTLVTLAAAASLAGCGYEPQPPARSKSIATYGAALEYETAVGTMDFNNDGVLDCVAKRTQSSSGGWNNLTFSTPQYKEKCELKFPPLYAGDFSRVLTPELAEAAKNYVQTQDNLRFMFDSSTYVLKAKRK